jgi:hypothetical protein
MAHTHEYDCIVCGAHFDSSQDLSRHNREQHLKHASGMEKPRASGNGAAESGLSDRQSEPPQN